MAAAKERDAWQQFVCNIFGGSSDSGAIKKEFLTGKSISLLGFLYS